MSFSTQDAFLYIILPLHLVVLIVVGVCLYRRAWVPKSAISKYILPANGCMPEHWLGYDIEKYCNAQLGNKRVPGHPEGSLSILEAFEQAGHPNGRHHGCHAPFQGASYLVVMDLDMHPQWNRYSRDSSLCTYSSP